MNKTVFRDEQLNEEYTVTECSSGLKVYMCEKPSFRSTHVLFGTKYGSIDNMFAVGDQDIKTVPDGIAHFLEHKLFESEELDAFERFSLTGASANAYTSFDKTCYLFSCSDRLYENLEILLDFVQSPFFTEETVKKEQGIIGQEITMYEDSPPWRVMFNFLKAIYKNHPVNTEIAGTKESIAEITAELLYDCYNTFYNPSNMFLCIAGNFESQKVLEIIEKSVKPKEAIPLTRSIPKEPDGRVCNYIEQNLEVATPIFVFGYKEKTDSGRRTPKEIVLTEVLLEMLAGKMSPLYERLLKKGLTNPDFEYEYFNGRSWSAIMFDGESNDPKAVAEEIKAEIQNAKRNGLKKDLFEIVKRKFYGQYVTLFNDVEEIASELVAAAVSDNGIFDTLNALREITFEEVQDRLSVFSDELSALSVIKKGE